MKNIMRFLRSEVFCPKPHSIKLFANFLISQIILGAYSIPSYAKCDIKTPSEVLKLIKSNHPRLSVNTLNNEFFEQKISVAKQRPNPELNMEVNFGEDSEGDTLTAAIDYKHVIELGNKRNARINLAKQEYNVKAAESIAGFENIIVKVVIDLYRLRQINESILLYKNAYHAFNNILTAKQKNNVQSPKEKVEGETISLAINDYQLRIAQLEAEKNYLNRNISFFAGVVCEIPSIALPAELKFNEYLSTNVEFVTNSQLLIAEKKLQLAKAFLSHENSNSYSDLKIGPLYEYETDYTDEYQTIGIALTMDLPILNQNTAGKKEAIKGISLAQQSYVNLINKNKNELNLWINKYNRYKSSLKTIANRSTSVKNHQKIESFYRRGLIPTSLVIESHRQLIEFTNTRYNMELAGVEALWNIYKLTGEIKNKDIPKRSLK